MLGNEFHLMHIIPVPWKHRGGHQLHQKQEKNTYSEMLFILSICEREREGELEIIIYSEQRYDVAC